jgi:ATP-dependent Clp protease ATP-binding subunit ClpA
MKRIIQDEIKDKIAYEILFGKLKKGGIVNIDYDKKSDSLSFSYQ